MGDKRDRKRKIKTKRWSEDDEGVYFCEACEMWHYKTSKIGRKHRKFERKVRR